LCAQLILIFQVRIHTVLDAPAVALLLAFKQGLSEVLLGHVHQLKDLVALLLHVVTVLVRFLDVALDRVYELCQSRGLRLMVNVSCRQLQVGLSKLIALHFVRVLLFERNFALINIC
jgi:hypothetical protein